MSYSTAHYRESVPPHAAFWRHYRSNELIVFILLNETLYIPSQDPSPWSCRHRAGRKRSSRSAQCGVRLQRGKVVAITDRGMGMNPALQGGVVHCGVGIAFGRF